jgi:hypothetical protein
MQSDSPAAKGSPVVSICTHYTAQPQDRNLELEYEVSPALILRTFAKEIGAGTTPTVREIKMALNLGQPKAMWVRDFLLTLTAS